MSSDPAIQAANLSKSYRIYARPQDRLLNADRCRVPRLAGASRLSRARGFTRTRAQQDDQPHTQHKRREKRHKNQTMPTYERH